MAAGPPPDTERSESGIADRTRPVYPYSFTASYIGSGSIDEAKNFKEGKLDPVPAAKLVWLGSSFYTRHYEEWCSANGTTMKDRKSVV